MSQTFDTNIWLYASNRTAPEFERANALLRHLALGPELVTVLWPVVMGYLRIATHPAIFDRPLSHADAVSNVDSFLSRPHVRLVAEGDRFWSSYRTVAAEARTSGNRVPDAHLVALMHEHGIKEIWTRDRGFRAYKGVRPKNPFDARDASGFA